MKSARVLNFVDPTLSFMTYSCQQIAKVHTYEMLSIHPPHSLNINVKKSNTYQTVPIQPLYSLNLLITSLMISINSLISYINELILHHISDVIICSHVGSNWPHSVSLAHTAGASEVGQEAWQSSQSRPWGIST